MMKAIAEEIIAYDPLLALKFEPIVKSLYKKCDYHEYGGAPLLGVNGACMIAHGSSEAKTIRAAIRNSRAFVQSGTNAAIVRRLAEHATARGSAKIAPASNGNATPASPAPTAVSTPRA